MAKMIDSVSLLLNSEQFALRGNNQFDGRKGQRIAGFTGKTMFCSKYAKQLKKQGIYCPMFEIATPKKGETIYPQELHIQVSLPKLLHGTNAFEIEENDLDKIYNKLLPILNDIGIDTELEKLQQAVVRSADFSKIVILPSCLGLANEVIFRLMRFNYKPSSEFNFTQYRDGKGASMGFYNSTQKYTIYDKIGEILAKGQTKMEQTIIKGFESGKLKRSPLKFELNLSRKDSFEKLIRQYAGQEKKRNFFLSEVLKKEIAKGVLLKIFDIVFNNTAVALISLSEMEENELLNYIQSSNLAPKKQIELYFYVRMATRNGIRGVWDYLERNYNGGSIIRHKKDIALALQEVPAVNKDKANLIKFLRDEHERFEIIKPKNNSQVVNGC